MSDDGFDFRRAAERREAKRFEPPPWEKAAFEEIEKRRAPEESSGEPENAPEQAQSEPPEAEVVAKTKAGTEGEAKLDEATLVEMLASLSVEDPPATRDYFAVSMGAALVMIALGAVLLMWGVAALVGARKTGPAASFAGTGLLLFGAGFLGGGMWMAYQALKRRGVL